MGKPELIRRLLCGGLALGLAGAIAGRALAAPALAAPVPTQKGKTTVGVQTADMAPTSLSYTVPLYLTVAAAAGLDGGPRVVTPEGYSLKNTTGSVPDGSYPDIVVTNVEVRGIAGGKWSLRAAPASDKQIRLSVGGLVLPEVNAGSTKAVNAAIQSGNNCFYNATDKKFLPIPGGPGGKALSLPIEGALPSVFIPTDEGAAAQFRIKYTVSLLDGAKNPIGISYDGPSKEEIDNPQTPSS